MVYLGSSALPAGCGVYKGYFENFLPPLARPLAPPGARPGLSRISPEGPRRAQALGLSPAPPQVSGAKLRVTKRGRNDSSR